MRVLQVTIEDAKFNEEHVYQISYQGRVESDKSALSANPKFQHASLYVPFAIVKLGKELLSVTLRKFEAGGEGEGVVVGREELVISPSKEAKHLVMKLPRQPAAIVDGASATAAADKDMVVSDIQGEIRLSYKVVTLSIIDALRGQDGGTGVNIGCRYFNTAPQDLAVRVKDRGSIVGTGKLTSLQPCIFVDTKRGMLDHEVTVVVSSSGSNASVECVMPAPPPGQTDDRPYTFLLKLQPESDAYAIITVLALRHGGEATALVHECGTAIPFARQGVCHFEFGSQGGGEEGAVVTYGGRVKASSVQELESGVLTPTVNAVAGSPSAGGSTAFPVPSDVGPDGGLYVLPSADGAISHDSDEPPSGASSGSQPGSRRASRASVHRDSIVRKSGKSVVQVGMLSVPPKVDLSRPMTIRASALSLMPKPVDDDGGNASASSVAFEACVVARGELQEVTREVLKGVVSVVFSGMIKPVQGLKSGALLSGSQRAGKVGAAYLRHTVKRIDEDGDGDGDEGASEPGSDKDPPTPLLPADSTDTDDSAGFLVTTTMSFVSRSDTAYFGPQLEATPTVAPAPAPAPIAEQAAEATPAPAPKVQVAETKPFSEAPRLMSPGKSPMLGVPEDPLSLVPPPVACINPRCVAGAGGHVMRLVTGVDRNRLTSSPRSAVPGGSGPLSETAVGFVLCDECGKKHLETHVSYFYCPHCSKDLCNTCAPTRIEENLMHDTVGIASTVLLQELISQATDRATLSQLLKEAEQAEADKRAALERKREDEEAQKERRNADAAADKVRAEEARRRAEARAREEEVARAALARALHLEEDLLDVALETVEAALVEEVVSDLLDSRKVARWVEKHCNPFPPLASESRHLPYRRGFASRDDGEEGEPAEDAGAGVGLQHSEDFGEGEGLRQLVAGSRKQRSPGKGRGGTRAQVAALEEQQSRLQQQLEQQGRMLKEQSARRSDEGGGDQTVISGGGGGSASGIVSVIRMELEDKQKLVHRLTRDVNARDEAIQLCGKDIRKLREENLLLRKDVEEARGAANRLAGDNLQAEEYVADLLGLQVKGQREQGGSSASSRLQMLGHGQLVKVAAALSKKIAAVGREKAAAEAYVAEAQAIRLQQAEAGRQLTALQEAHMEQSRVLGRAQREARKLDKYRSTVELQEQVIAKLQAVVEERIREGQQQLYAPPPQQQQLLAPWPPQQGVLSPTDAPAANMSPSPEPVPSPVLAPAPVPTMDDAADAEAHAKHTRALEARVTEADKQVQALRVQVQQLQHAAKQREKALERAQAQAQRVASEGQLAVREESLSLSEARKQLEALKAEVAVKDIRVAALQERLEKGAQENAREVARLRMLLFELEMSAGLDADDDEQLGGQLRVEAVGGSGGMGAEEEVEARARGDILVRTASGRILLERRGPGPLQPTRPGSRDSTGNGSGSTPVSGNAINAVRATKQLQQQGSGVIVRSSSGDGDDQLSESCGSVGGSSSAAPLVDGALADSFEDSA